MKAISALLFTAALAAASTVATAGTWDPGINHRQYHQHQRIQQGVRSGQLTRPEARRLRNEQRAIRTEERLFKSDGKLTQAERRNLQQDLNAASRDIYRQKHDAQTR